MAFRAVHANWRTVFAHLPDLGCGQAWEAVWKVKPPAPITFAECRHPMYAKTSRSGMQFFAHAPHAPGCEIAREGESEAHHLLKLDLAWAGRDAGAHAELEVRAPDGSWRADVLASASDGSVEGLVRFDGRSWRRVGPTALPAPPGTHRSLTAGLATWPQVRLSPT
ncbi:hypothetical protein [Embleya sp. NPDC005971]|uniref:hypothetical protein n=1 Tax=Embleya sp. NPDC005971 TaxID=3156724 RepID=UPI0033C870BD